MIIKNKDKILFQRLLIWTFYLFSGFILYFKKGSLYPFLITFTKLVFPLSIFWLQLTIKKSRNLLQIDSAMSTSQLWFNILPALASMLAVIFTVLNSLIYVFFKLIN